MYEMIVFDLDGTLLDTLDDLWEAVNAALQAHGLKLREKEEVRGFVGNGIVKLMQRAIGKEDYPHFDAVLATFKEYYGAHCKDKTRPYEGIMPLLRILKERGAKLAVVSNKADFAVKVLAKEYFGDLLCAAIGENEAAGVRKKPAPDSLLEVMRQCGVTAENTVYVGDSEVDIKTAKNAGVACVSVTWGFKDRAFLLQNGATTLADAPAQLVSLL
ncbi:MAG: HAD-IIIA family hydrolase [Clostridia bacterium]|nr:HAD-IIIA family hydrolase [Clostridia bacterium]